LSLDRTALYNLRLPVTYKFRRRSLREACYYIGMTLHHEQGYGQFPLKHGDLDFWHWQVRDITGQKPVTDVIDQVDMMHWSIWQVHWVWSVMDEWPDLTGPTTV